MPTSTTRAHMEEKYEWAQQAAEEIKWEAHKFFGATPPTDTKKLQRSFWAFLEAYQQIRAHHGRWMKEAKVNKKQGELLDGWKAKFLTSSQSILWDAVYNMRTQNAHSEPVFPDISIREAARVTQTGGIRLTHSGTPRIAIINYVAVKIEKEEYNLLKLVTFTLLALREFIDTFDQAEA
jgi:hypothetical protein